MIYREDIDISFAIVGALIGALIGEVNGLLIALIVFMVVDYITGVLAAIMSKKLSSAVGFRGLIGKACILLVVILGNVVDVYVVQSGAVCRTACILFYLSNEGISIVENYCILGLPFPEKLKKVLEQLTNDDE